MILGLINRGFSAKPAFTQKPSNAYTVRIKGAKALLPVFLYRCFCKSPFSENEKPFCRNSFTKLCKPFAHWQPQPDWFYLLTITGAEALTATICTLAASTGLVLPAHHHWSRGTDRYHLHTGSLNREHDL